MALRNQPYIPLYVQDFLTNVKLSECNAESTGVYIKIMCLMHKSETYGTILLKQKDKQTEDQIVNFALKLLKHLPFTLPEISRGLTELLCEKCLLIDGDLLIQPRMIKDNDISEKRANAGKSGGLSTQNALKPKQNKFAKAKTKANHENESDIENENKIDFLIFWGEYDKKVGDKEKLIKKWDALSYNDQNEILNHIILYKQAQPDKKFRKDPATYLNNKSWRDEIISNSNIATYSKTANVIDIATAAIYKEA